MDKEGVIGRSLIRNNGRELSFPAMYSKFTCVFLENEGNKLQNNIPLKLAVAASWMDFRSPGIIQPYQCKFIQTRSI